MKENNDAILRELSEVVTNNLRKDRERKRETDRRFDGRCFVRLTYIYGINYHSQLFQHFFIFFFGSQMD